MKIEYKNGSVLHTPYELIAHGCNAQGVMGAGVAGVIRREIPGVYEDYRHVYNTGGLHLGDVLFYEGIDKLGSCRIIASCITQRYFGRDPDRVYVNYPAIERCMEKINTFCRDNGIKHVAMPKIGCGLGGGDWSIIESIIEEKLIGTQPVVYIF